MAEWSDPWAGSTLNSDPILISVYTAWNLPILIPWFFSPVTWVSCSQVDWPETNEILSFMLSPWAGYQCTPSLDAAQRRQSACAVNMHLTGGHYPFRECQALSAFPWTAGPQGIVALSKFKQCQPLLKHAVFLYCIGALGTMGIELHVYCMLGFLCVRHRPPAKPPFGELRGNFISSLTCSFRLAPSLLERYKPIWLRCCVC